MKLPRRGCLIGADGKVKWAWSHTRPDTDFEGLPPITSFDDGTSSFISEPDDIIMDVESVLADADMLDMYHDMTKARFRRDGDMWKIKLIVDVDVGGEKVETEIDHPVQKKAALHQEKRKANEKANR